MPNSVPKMGCNCAKIPHSRPTVEKFSSAKVSENEKLANYWIFNV